MVDTQSAGSVILLNTAGYLLPWLRVTFWPSSVLLNIFSTTGSANYKHKNKNWTVHFQMSQAFSIFQHSVICLMLAMHKFKILSACCKEDIFVESKISCMRAMCLFCRKTFRVRRSRLFAWVYSYKIYFSYELGIHKIYTNLFHMKVSFL